jgi:hypothetical protein
LRDRQQAPVVDPARLPFRPHQEIADLALLRVEKPQVAELRLRIREQWQVDVQPIRTRGAGRDDTRRQQHRQQQAQDATSVRRDSTNFCSSTLTMTSASARPRNDAMR